MQTPSPNHLRRALGALLISTAALLPVSVHGAMLTVANFSFENPSTSSFTNGNQNGVNPAIMTDWNYNSAAPSSSYGVQLSSSTQFNPGQITGAQFGYLNSNDTLASITSASLGIVSLNTNYTLTVALGKRLDNVSFTDQGQFSLSILVDGTAKATTPVNGTSLTAGTLTDFSVTWNSGATGTGALTAQITWDNVFNRGPDNVSQGPFDNVRIDATAAPEPASLTLALVAAAAFAALRVRRAGRVPSPAHCLEPTECSL